MPFDDKGYLKSIYSYSERIGVGLGGPDLIVTRIRTVKSRPGTNARRNLYRTPLGIAIQDGNYIGKTGADSDYNEEHDKGKKERKNKVPMLLLKIS